MKVARLLPLFGLALSAAGSAETGSGETGAGELAALMDGSFATRADAPGTAYRDFRTPIATLGDGQWVYFQRNQGSEMAVYRQRVLQLVDRPDGSVAQITHRLADAERFAGAPDDPAVLATVSAGDLVPLLDDRCEQHWRRIESEDGPVWIGRVDPERCTIMSQRRQMRIAIGSETRLSGDAIHEAERGFDLDGNQLWGTPPGEFSVIYRQSGPAE